MIPAPLLLQILEISVSADWQNKLLYLCLAVRNTEVAEHSYGTIRGRLQKSGKVHMFVFG